MNPITDTIIQYLTQKTYLFTINKLIPVDHTEECINYIFMPVNFTIIQADTFEDAMYQICIEHPNPQVFLDTIIRLLMITHRNEDKYYNWVGDQLKMGHGQLLHDNLLLLEAYCKNNLDYGSHCKNNLDYGSLREKIEDHKSTIYHLNNHQKKKIIDKGLADRIFNKDDLYKALREHLIIPKCSTYSNRNFYYKYKYTLIHLGENNQMINFDRKMIKYHSNDSTIVH